jgi:hypothetical protein
MQQQQQQRQQDVLQQSRSLQQVTSVASSVTCRQ